MSPSVAFLDRDGTLIVEKHYLCDPALVELERHAVDGLRLLQSLGLTLVVLTNQSGIGRGKFAAADAHAVNQRVDALLRAEGVQIAGWYMCPHAPDTSCTCRKPLPGMIQQAQAELGIQAGGAVVIGDKRSDVELAETVQGTGILVTTGHGLNDQEWAEAHGHPTAPDLLQAAHLVGKLLNA